MEKENNLDSREKDEKVEGEKSVESDVPSGRFQKKQQIQKPVKKQMDEKVEENPFNPKKLSGKGSQLKQEQVARVITGTGGSAPVEGVASPSRAGLRTLSYSGNEGTILGNPSGTPVVGSPSRSDTRPGQKLDAVAKAIDFIASEQAYQEVEGSKPLQDNPNEVQGFLGHPENNSARVQKVAEAVPGALLYARSLDEIKRDEIAYVEGQMIEEKDVDAKVSPTLTYDPVTKTLKPFIAKRGNFIPKIMRLGIDANGQVHAINFDVDDVSIVKGSDIVNRSSSAYIRAANIDEINRQNMEKVAGVETEKNWCPLVRVVEQPTQTVGYLTDDEITTGSELWMAYRFFCKAHSYFFNKAAKDGQLPYRSFKEMLKGNTKCFKSSTSYTDAMTVFDRNDYVLGAPSLMIALYDSIAKYSKRGDLLTQPRSWKMHKQTADNNINPFRINPILARYVSNRDVFSTIDRGYDPLLPTCISDNWRCSHVQNFANLMNITHATTFKLKLGGKGAIVAGVAFNNVYDNIKGASPSDTATLKAFSSGTAGLEIYSYYGLTGSANHGSPVIIFAGDKTGFDTADAGLAAAETALYNYDHSGNNARVKPVVCLYKVKGTPDDVYAIVRYPGIINITTSANVKLFIKHSTTDDYMSSDTSVDTVILNTNEALDVDHFVYKYQNRQNPYVVKVLNPLLYGIKEWAENMGAKLANPSASNGTTAAADLRDGQGILWYNIPIVHSTRNLSLWDLIVCASVPFMQKIRTNSQYDTLNYEDANGKYPYSQLASISEMNPLASSNYVMSDILQPLKVGTMKPAVALSWIIPEKFWRVASNTTSHVITSETFVLPFYFSEEAVRSVLSTDSNVSAKMESDGFLMNYPSTRAGARSSYLDDFYGMSERDIRLCLDMLTDIPGSDAPSNGPIVEAAYKYGLSNSGIPVITYTNANKALTIGEYLKCPRELGLGCVAPIGYNSVANNIHLSSGACNVAAYTTLDTLMSLGTSYSARTWKVHDGVYKALHDPTQLVVTRGGNFAQDWAERCDAVYAYQDNVSNLGYGFSIDKAVDIGVALNFNDVMEVTDGSIIGESGGSTFKPFAFGDNVTNSSLPTIITMQKALWTRVQMLPFALSPFDQTPECRLSDGNAVVFDMTADPYDFMYIFGFAGFKASDFREDAYNRFYEKINLGWTYVTDPFVEASPVLK